MNIIKQAVEGSFRVEICEWEGFTFRMLQHTSRPESDPFLVSTVSKDNKLLWEYSVQHRGFKGLGFLVDYLGDKFIVLEKNHELHEVISVRHLPEMRRIGGVYVGGPRLEEMIAVKKMLAEKRALWPVWSPIEMQMIAVMSRMSASAPAAVKGTPDMAQGVLAEERAALESKRATARAEREAKKARINGRHRLFVFTAAGDRRHGIPVVGDEWMSLQDGAFCVSVTSFNEETGAVGNVQESFAVVKKGGGNPSRAHVTGVFRENPVRHQESGVNLDDLELKLVPVKGIRQPVVVAKNVDQIRALCTQGLNSGTYAMAPKENDNGRFVVYRLTGGTYESVTEIKRVSA
jgi:hypothetical protein